MEARLAKQGRELAVLRARLERYESALQGSNVTVFTQLHDRGGALRFASISNSLLGQSIERIVGSRDEDVFPKAGLAQVVSLKQRAIDSPEGASEEIALGTDGATRWFDLHAVPLRENGKTVGLACAAIDITDRKTNETHLRLLLRELTHRSKNLLAVIQAMARQTARHAGDTESFLDHFNARLHALAASHDLLVRENWRGVEVQELVLSHMKPYMDAANSAVSVSGPPVVLRPEAAQSLGLALHELMANAAAYGALSIPAGRVEIVWKNITLNGSSGLELSWLEKGGPTVKQPSHQGFGTLVIDHNLVRALNAKVTLAYESGGLRCEIVLPPTEILPSR